MSNSPSDATGGPTRPRRRFTVDALFSDTRPQSVGLRDLPGAKLIDVGRIVTDPRQPRRSLDPDRLKELAASIRAEGILQPVVVRFDAPNDRFIIVHGERRFRAAGMAGLSVVPALIRDVPADRRLLQQLMENVVRDDLNAVDRAAALRELRTQLGDPSWDDVATAVGIRRSRLFQLLGTEKLSLEAQQDIRAGNLSEKQSRMLQGLSPARQEAFRELLASGGVSQTLATRLARAFRDLPLKDETAETARGGLRQLRDLVAADEPGAIRQQLSTLLRAIRQARQPGGDERQLKQYTRLLAAPSFTSRRISSDMINLVRTMASMPPNAIARDDQLAESLRDLRATLDVLVPNERQ